jgi:hypothetical protein
MIDLPVSTWWLVVAGFSLCCLAACCWMRGASVPDDLGVPCETRVRGELLP